MKPHIKRIQLSAAGNHQWVWALYRTRTSPRPIAMSRSFDTICFRALRAAARRKK